MTPLGKSAHLYNRIMKIAIGGMHCQACVQRVRKALEKVEGADVKQVEVGSAEVVIDPVAHPGGEAAALEAVRKAGYTPHTSGG